MTQFAQLIDDLARRVQDALTTAPIPLSVGRHPDELALLRVLRDAGAHGMTTRQLARHLGDSGLGRWVGGRLRVLARKRLVRALPHQPDRPARWVATLPAAHPASRGLPPPGPLARTWTRERVLEALQAWDATHARPPTYEQWRRAGPGRPLATTVERLFAGDGGWSGAIRAAGLAPRGRASRQASKADQPEPTGP